VLFSFDPARIFADFFNHLFLPFFSAVSLTFFFVFASVFRRFWLNFVFGDEQFAPFQRREKIVFRTAADPMSLIHPAIHWGSLVDPPPCA